MPSQALQRKLDLLTRSGATTVPRVLMDVIFLIVGELDRRENEHRSNESAIAQLDAAAKDPTRDAHREMTAIRSTIETLSRDAQQLEHTIREAEASFSVQYEVKRARMEASLKELSCNCERLLRDEIPSAISTQLQRVAALSKEISQAALQTTATALRDMKLEVTGEVEDTVKHQCAAALDQFREESEVEIFGGIKRIEAEYAKLRDQLGRNAADAARDIHTRATHCAAFLGEKVAKVLHYEPLLEVHRLESTVQYCTAQVQLLQDARGPLVDVHAINGRLLLLEQAAMELRRSQRPLAGFVALWDADDDVLDELADVPSSQLDPYVASMKADYLRKLPALRNFTTAPTAAKTPHQHHSTASPSRRTQTPMHTPPPPDHSSKGALLRELSAKKSNKRIATHNTPVPKNSERNTPELSQLPSSSHAATAVREADSVAGVFAALFDPHRSAYELETSTILDASTVQPSVADENDEVIVELTDSPKRPHPIQPRPLGLRVGDGDPLAGGVVVVEVPLESTMDRHGVSVDDQLLSINGFMIRDRDHVAEVLQGIYPGDSLRMHFFRPASSKVFIVQTLR